MWTIDVTSPPCEICKALSEISQGSKRTARRSSSKRQFEANDCFLLRRKVPQNGALANAPTPNFSGGGEPRYFFFDMEFFFFKARDLKAVNARAALGFLNGIGQALVFPLQFLQMGCQAHGYPPCQILG